MKIVVKTLKGSNFDVEVDPQSKVADVKKLIETSQGRSVYPAEQLMLIHQGKILKDETTLDENKIAENSFVVIMLNKAKTSSGEASTTAKTTANQASPTSTVAPVPSTPAAATTQVPASASVPAAAPSPSVAASPAPAVTVSSEADVYGQAASNLVAGNHMEQTIQQILDMGAGSWDRDTVMRALRAAFNNPERAIEYLYSGVPEQADGPPVAQVPDAGADSPVPLPLPVQPPVLPGGPNAIPLDLFPQGLPNVAGNAGAGSLDFLRNNPQFRGLQSLVQDNPQILQPMLQELAKQNPQIMRLIQEHQDEFLQLLNEPAEGSEGSLLGQLAAEMPPTVQVTPEESEAIGRLEALGFDRGTVLEVFFACNKNEELAANYLLDHVNDFDE